MKFKTGPNSKSVLERFQEKYIVDEETGCFNWIGSLDSTGSGSFSYNSKTVRAYIFSYQYFKGPIIKGLVCCHSCHNRSCVNPEHLRLDSQRSNSLDMVNAKRQWEQILTVEDVIKIKKELPNYYRGQITELSKRFGVSKSVICDIKAGRSWSHVEVER